MNDPRFGDLLSEPLRNGLTRPKAVRGEGTKMVNMGELFAHRRIGDIEMSRVPVADRESRFLLAYGDLLFARQSLVLAGAGLCSIFIGRDEATFESHIIRARLDPAKADSRYFAYYFSSTQGRNRIESIVEQVAAAGIRSSDLSQLRVPCPPVEEQVGIAETLSGIDDKIEHNRKTSAKLEELARALFAFWFGVLDPDRAPHGWTVVSLSGHVEVTRGLSYTGAGLAVDGVPLHNLDSIFEGGGYKYEGIKHYRGDYKDRNLVRAGDLLVVNTEQGFDHLLIGFPALVPERFGDKSLYSADLFRMKPSPHSHLTTRFLYLALMSPRLRQLIVGYSNGTTVNHLAADGLRRPRLGVPPADVVQRFDRTVAPLFAKQQQLQLESETLAQLRDLLLPKLMSGEIRLTEAEKAVAETL